MARQLGLGVSRIVIDPGHGGHDPGAKGKGVTEAELVLDVALRLEKLLQKVPGVEVILTRRTDDFIPLPERTAIANREGADLFLSIHANASTNGQAHGIETYFLNFANNQSAAAVAARENAASTQAMGGAARLRQGDRAEQQARRVARLRAARAARDGRRVSSSANKALKDLGVKQAPFVVLIGANMPSVLAEMGFVTNAQEAKLLKSERLPPEDRRVAVQRDPQVPDVAQERLHRRASVDNGGYGATGSHRKAEQRRNERVPVQRATDPRSGSSASLRSSAALCDPVSSVSSVIDSPIGPRTSRPPSPRRAAPRRSR